MPRTKPNYRSSPEAVMAKEHANFTPWKVDLIYRESLLDADDHSVTLFVRAPNPSRAMHVARRIWAYYTKEKPTPRGEQIPEWPQLDDRCDVMCIDDADYMQIWKYAQAYKRYWSGNEDNPIGFHFESQKRIHN
jgi:hypothetical protein